MDCEQKTSSTIHTKDNSIDNAKKDDVLTAKDEAASELSTVNFSQDENILNRNIDAIEDDETFLDCPSYSPLYSAKKFRKSPSFTAVNTSFGNFLTVSSTSNGVYSSEEQTGSFIAEMMNDFNDIKDKAQSTPNEEVRRGFRTNLSFKRKFSFSNEDESQNGKIFTSNENNNSSPESKPKKKVAKMKEFFESKINEKSNAIPQVRVSISNNNNSKTFKIPKLVDKFLSHLKSSTHKTMSVSKLKLSPVRENKASSSQQNISRYLRVSSCSDYLASEETCKFTSSIRSRCHSDGDALLWATDDASTQINCKLRFQEAMETGAISTRKRRGGRPYFLNNRKVTSPGSSAGHNESKIRNRRSVGMMSTESPIKPVSVLRQAFTPSAVNNNAANEMKLKN